MQIFLQQNIVPPGGGKGPPISAFRLKQFEFI